jgi:fatty acid desaturase
MSGPDSLLSGLKEITKNPREFIAVGLPSLLGSLLFSIVLWLNRGRIHPSLTGTADLPAGYVDLFFWIFVSVTTILIFLVILSLSHIIHNQLYMWLWANRKHKNENSCYQTLRNNNLIEGSLESKYYNFRDELKKRGSEVANRADVLETRSKFFRTLSVVLLLGAIVIGYWQSWWLIGVLVLLSVIMFFEFCRLRWQASDDICRKIYEIRMKNRSDEAPI